MEVTAVTQATTIRPSMTAYSTAVGPSSEARKRLTLDANLDMAFSLRCPLAGQMFITAEVSARRPADCQQARITSTETCVSVAGFIPAAVELNLGHVCQSSKKIFPDCLFCESLSGCFNCPALSLCLTGITTSGVYQWQPSQHPDAKKQRHVFF